MAYTFGGATGDDINFTAASGAGATTVQTLTAGWWFPTTLTATRGYWSNAAIYGMEVDGTTSAVRFRTDNTTDGQWTAPAGITVDKWWFIAAASTQLNATPAAGWRLWVGDADNPPSEIAVTQATAPVGNFVGSSNMVLGNKGNAGTLAFQGHIGWLSRITQTGSGTRSILGIGTSGAISDAEAEFIRQRWVIPLWDGNPRIDGPYQWADIFSITHIPLRSASVYSYSSDQTFGSYQEATINGATFSELSPPSAPPENWPLMAPYVRR